MKVVWNRGTWIALHEFGINWHPENRGKNCSQRLVNIAMKNGALTEGDNKFQSISFFSLRIERWLKENYTSALKRIGQMGSLAPRMDIAPMKEEGAPVETYIQRMGLSYILTKNPEIFHHISLLKHTRINDYTTWAQSRNSSIVYHHEPREKTRNHSKTLIRFKTVLPRQIWCTSSDEGFQNWRVQEKGWTQPLGCT